MGPAWSVVCNGVLQQVCETSQSAFTTTADGRNRA